MVNPWAVENDSTPLHPARFLNELRWWNLAVRAPLTFTSQTHAEILEFVWLKFH